MSHHITEVPITFLFPADLVFHPLRKSWSFYLLINFLVSHLEKKKAAHIPIISLSNKIKSDENVAKSQWGENDARSLLYVQNAFHVGLQQSRSTGAYIQPGWGRKKKRNHHSLPVGCLVDSNKRSSRFTGAHWRTRSSEPSAQSQDLQSPQPIRGYTGGLELLVGGAKYSNETGPTTCSPADGRLNGQLRRTSWNTRLCIRWSLAVVPKTGSGDPWGSLRGFHRCYRRGEKGVTD